MTWLHITQELNSLQLTGRLLVHINVSRYAIAHGLLQSSYYKLRFIHFMSAFSELPWFQQIHHEIVLLRLKSQFHHGRWSPGWCIFFGIHTGSSANVEGPRAHCQLNLCKMVHKCSTDCIWKSMQPVNDLGGHSRSPPSLPFDRPYTISYSSSIVSISLFCTVFEMSTLICQKVNTSRDLDHAHLGNSLSLQE